MIRIGASLDRTDKILLLFLSGLTALLALPYVRPSLLPYEDNLMLFRYAQNLAQGHGIVWNVGGTPVDGGTDFLLLVLLAGLNKVGIPLIVASRSVNLISQILTVDIVYIAVRSLLKSARSLALTSAAFVIAGPGVWYIAACFGTPFFALLVALTWYFALKIRDEAHPNVTALGFSLTALVMGLTRPEGVFLSLFMVGSILYWRGFKGSKEILLRFFLVFITLGGAYFLWHWRYFGYPLPNPYYRKGGGHLYWGSLLQSVKNVALLTWPVCMVFMLGFRKAKTARVALFSLIPILGFTTIWILLSNEMNVWRRFQYPVLLLVLMVWPALLEGISGDLKLPKFEDLHWPVRAGLLGTLCLFLLSVLAYNEHEYGKEFGSESQRHDGRHDLALELRQFKGNNYTMAVSEAGHLPFDSGWRSIDAVGLNDAWVAHHNGQIAESYLAESKPELIMFHAPFSPLVPPTQGTSVTQPWLQMTLTLNKFAVEHGYCLAAALSDTPYEAHYYYVRPDFPDSGKIVEIIRHTPYIWLYTGRLSMNWAMQEPSTGPGGKLSSQPHQALTNGGCS